MPAVDHYAYPELVPEQTGESRNWTVKRSVDSGQADFASSTLHVPMGDTPQDRNIRRHELGHVRWTPMPLPDDLDYAILQSVEDARMHLLLTNAAGLDLSDGLLSQKVLEEQAARLASNQASMRDVVLLLLSTSSTGSYEQVRQAVAGKLGWDAKKRARLDEGQRLVEQALAVLQRDGATPAFASTVEVVKWLQKALPPPSESEKERSDAHVQFYESLVPAYRNGSVTWGEMEIETPDLTETFKGTRGGKAWRCTDSGVVPRDLARWATDKQVFGVRRRAQGGTVLIDGSGSMHLTPDQLLTLVETAPGAMVAIYSGYDTAGILRILASRGRRVPDHLVRAPASYHNTVDGPALRWLMGRPGPRVWVSDGQASGILHMRFVDNWSAYLTEALEECQELCRVGHIKQVISAERAIEWFRSFGGTGGW